MSNNEFLREIPSVNLIIQSDKGQKLVEDYSHEMAVEAIRFGADRFRLDHGSEADNLQKHEKKELKDFIQEEVLTMAREYLESKFAPSLKRVINGTGTIIHTNLGRAKLSEDVKEALLEAAFSFSNLEYNVEEGERGSRYQHLESTLCDLTNAEAALVVNNNAAAIMLALDTLAKGKEVIVSRGELVEIGGSFRIPEIIKLSGCKLKEVGTTNKTHDFDYRNAFSENTAAILKVHSSNYKITGFTKEVSVEEISKIVQEHNINITYEGDNFRSSNNNIPIIHDMGSGMLIDLEKYGLPYEMTVRDSLENGADIVTFSGDKVLGGPQAGIIAGKKKYIDMMRKNQLTRALRVDKMTIATLEATLRLYYDEEKAMRKIPALKMLMMALEELEKKAYNFAAQLSNIHKVIKVEVVDTYSQVGGGAYPGEEVRSKAIALSSEQISVNQLSEKLRKAQLPIISKIRNEKCELDMRTIEEEEFAIISDTLMKIAKMD